MGVADVDPLSTGRNGQRSVNAICLARRGLAAPEAPGAGSAGRRALVVAVALIAALGGTRQARGHVADTSYVRFQVSPGGIETKFSFDFATLQRIAPGLDANADHRVTPDELAGQTAAVYSYLRSHVRFEIDGATADFGAEQPVSYPPEADPAGVVEAKYHDVASLTHFVFAHPLPRPPADFWAQFEVFGELGPRHTVLGAIEHAGKRHEVVFTESEPDYLYDTGYQTPGDGAPGGGASGEKARVGNAPPGSSASDRASAEGSRADGAAPAAEPARSGSGRSNANASAWSETGRFFGLGVEHIFLGYDHILFLLSLLVVSRFRELIKIVTSFTVAHTITLMLATLDVVRLPSRLVESAIAATIVFVAVENFWVRDTSHRWRLTFFCGLIHGFGFAGVLQELGLPTEGLVRSLVAFNLGVEAGQLVIVAALVPFVTALGRWRYGRQAQLAISGAIALCGAGWLVDRAFGLGLMPF